MSKSNFEDLFLERFCFLYDKVSMSCLVLSISSWACILQNRICLSDCHGNKSSCSKNIHVCVYVEKGDT